MPVIFGVETMNTFRRANVRVRASARLIGSPSPSTSPG
jgi:6,7-dimethyl-8-ribityllumazine synthase